MDKSKLIFVLCGLPLVIQATLVDVIVDGNISIKIQTCRGECGLSRSYPCSCHAQCFVYNNCCENISEDCPNIADIAHNLFGSLIGVPIQCHETGVRMVSGCQSQMTVQDSIFEGFVVEPEMSEVEKAILTAPVTELTTALTFTNRLVYQCFKEFQNSSSLLSRWNLKIPTNIVSNPSSLDDLEALLHKSSFEPNFNHSILYGSLCPSSVWVVDYCGGGDTISREQCQASFTSYVESNLTGAIYRNRFCLACNEGYNSPMHQPSIRERIYLRSSMQRFSILLSLSASGAYNLALYDEEEDVNDARPPGWATVQCEMTNNMPDRSTREMTCYPDCMPGFEIRPNGVCKMLHKFQIAVPDKYGVHDLCPGVISILPQFLICGLEDWLEDIEFVSEVSSNPTEHYDERLETGSYVVELQFYLTTKEDVTGTSMWWREEAFGFLSIAIQAFLEFWRSGRAEDSGMYCSDYSKDKDENNRPVPIITSRSFEASAKEWEMFLRSSQKTNRGEMVPNTTSISICLTGTSFDGQTSPYKLACVQDSVRIKDDQLVDTFLNSTCLDLHLGSSSRGFVEERNSETSLLLSTDPTTVVLSSLYVIVSLSQRYLN